MKYILIALVLMSSNVQALPDATDATGSLRACDAMGYIQQGVSLLRDSGMPHKEALENMLIGQIKSSVGNGIIFRLKLTKRMVDFTYLNPKLSADQLYRRSIKVCTEAIN